jgi:small-conductance mechanosensitive channel
MFEPFAPHLEHWREFYLLVGTAAAALVALLFVAASIGAGYLSAARASATRVFTSPVVFHFTAVLMACSLGLIPSHTRASFALLIGAGSLMSGIYSIRVSLRVLESTTIDRADKLFYGTAPVLAYAAGLVAAGLIFLDSRWGIEVLAGALFVLLLDNIRNAWDLMLFFSEKHSAPNAPPPPQDG